ncbi:MAG: hypothetical protein IJ317_01575, partial [Clostridia bacterium]|nr:hypothetical protein [Clostridia bacterium]
LQRKGYLAVAHSETFSQPILLLTKKGISVFTNEKTRSTFRRFFLQNKDSYESVRTLEFYREAPQTFLDDVAVAECLSLYYDDDDKTLENLTTWVAKDERVFFDFVYHNERGKNRLVIAAGARDIEDERREDIFKKPIDLPTVFTRCAVVNDGISELMLEDDFGTRLAFNVDDEDVLEKADEFFNLCLDNLAATDNAPNAQSVETQKQKSTAETPAQEPVEEITETPEEATETQEESPTETPAENVDEVPETFTEETAKETVETPIAPPAQEDAQTSAETLDDLDEADDLEELDSAKAIAKKLLLESAPSNESAYKALSDRLIAERRDAVALTLLEALKPEGETYEKWAKQLSCVLGYDVKNESVSLSAQDLYGEFEEYSPADAEFTYKNCAYLRYITTVAHDYGIIDEMKNALGDRSGYWDARESFKDVFSTCIKSVEELNNRGLHFTPKLIAMMNSGEKHTETVKAHAEEAKKLMSKDYWLPRDPSPIFPVAFKHAFDKGSLLYDALEVIAKNDADGADVQKVRDAYDYFYEDGNRRDDRLEEYKEDAWGKAKSVKSSGKRTSKLTDKIANNFQMKCIARLDLIEAFLKNVDGTDTIDEKKLKIAMDERGKIVAKAQTALDQFCAQTTADAAIVEKTLKDAIEYLNNGKPLSKTRWNYQEFLASGEVELDVETAAPVMERYAPDFDGMQLYKWVLKHVASDKKQVSEQTLDEAFGNDEYSRMELVAKYLRDHNVPLSAAAQAKLENNKAKPNAEKNFKTRQNSLKAEFEMEYMRGTIDEEFESRGLKLATSVMDRAKVSGNFGVAERVFNVLRENIRKQGEKKRAALWKQLEEHLSEKDETEYPILKDARKQIESGNLKVAEEYLAYASKGEKKLNDLVNREEKNYHEEFVSLYDKLKPLCDEYKTVSFSKLFSASDFLEKMQAIFGANYNKTEGVRLLDSFSSPNSFIGKLGFSVINSETVATANKSAKFTKFNLNPTAKGKEIYQHPVKQFGTGLKSLTAISIKNKQMNAESIKSLIVNHDQDCGEVNIVVYDGVLPDSEKRMLAKNMKTLGSSKTVLVIEKTLCLYLSSIDENSRLKALLQCALPYAGINSNLNPYNAGGSGTDSLWDEMFFGREEECGAIKSISDPRSLVCGGRQLGKSALLLRARNMMHKPSDLKYAFYFSNSTASKETVSNEILRGFTHDLFGAKLLKSEDSINTWDDFCQEIETLFKTGRIHELCLLIDEGDCFIEWERENGYKTLEKLHLTRKKTDAKFKFVLAGLHNISRESHLNGENNFIAQLGKPVVIKPLSQSEARALVEKPLAYFGYRFENGNNQVPMILSHTNYYPGLLHLFCSELLKHLSKGYTKYFSETNAPPYVITDNLIREIIDSSDFNAEVKKKFLLTVQGLDPRYEKLALAICTLYLDGETANNGGYTVSDIRKVCEDWDVAEFRNSSETEYKNLLDEMVDLGVLLFIRSEDNRNGKYLFLRNVFFNYVIATVDRKENNDLLDDVYGKLLGDGE